MRAVLFDGKLSVREHPTPIPGPREALIRMHMGGICNTDVEILRGYMAFKGILGHEFVGVVEECGDPS